MSLLNDSNCSCNLLSSKTLHYAMSLLHYITSCCNRKFGTKTFKSSGHCVNTPKLLGRVIHCKTEGWMRNSSDSRWTYPSAVVLRIVLHQAQCKSKTRGISSICTNSNSIGITSGNLCVCVCVCVCTHVNTHTCHLCVCHVCVCPMCVCVCACKKHRDTDRQAEEDRQAEFWIIYAIWIQIREYIGEPPRRYHSSLKQLILNLLFPFPCQSNPHQGLPFFSDNCCLNFRVVSKDGFHCTSKSKNEITYKLCHQLVW